MQAPALMRAAVTCDYAAECLSFLRHFDADEVDPATTSSYLARWQDRMKCLFHDGYILGNSRDIPNSLHVETTASQMVFEEIENPEPPLGISLFGTHLSFLVAFIFC